LRAGYIFNIGLLWWTPLAQGYDPRDPSNPRRAKVFPLFLNLPALYYDNSLANDLILIVLYLFRMATTGSTGKKLSSASLRYTPFTERLQLPFYLFLCIDHLPFAASIAVLLFSRESANSSYYSYFANFCLMERSGILDEASAPIS
jgi:hypothetical protein